MTFNDLVAQLAHVGWGSLLVLFGSAHWGLAAVTGAVAAFAIGKEAIESLWGVWEPVQPWLSGLEDVAFWGVGIGLGLLLHII